MKLNKADLTEFKQAELRYIKRVEAVDFKTKEKTGEFVVTVQDNEEVEHKVKVKEVNHAFKLGDLVEFTDVEGTFYVSKGWIACSLKATSVEPKGVQQKWELPA